MELSTPQKKMGLRNSESGDCIRRVDSTSHRPNPAATEATATDRPKSWAWCSLKWRMEHNWRATWGWCFQTLKLNVALRKSGRLRNNRFSLVDVRNRYRLFKAGPPWASALSQQVTGLTQIWDGLS